MENNTNRKQHPKNGASFCCTRVWTNSNLSKTFTSSVQDPGSRRNTRPHANKENKSLVSASKNKRCKEENVLTVVGYGVTIVGFPNYATPALKYGQFYRLLQSYLLTREQRLTLGYPVEQTGNPGEAIIFNTPPRLRNVYKPNGVLQNSVPCARCGSEYFAKKYNQGLCEYHFGKLVYVNAASKQYTCCGGEANTKGCTQGRQHVWTGLVSGINGPFNDFVKTRPTFDVDLYYGPGVYAIDGEMCFTTKGLELCKVSVVSMDGKVVYDQYVIPENEVIDYNTQFSGVTAEHIHRKGTKTLKDVQRDLNRFVHETTILIGHGLENDLRALRLLHSMVIDTAVAFPHPNGLPFRRSLKSLVSSFLGRDIQTGSNGHNSSEDAQACMELMFLKVTMDFGPLMRCASALNRTVV